MISPRPAPSRARALLPKAAAGAQAGRETTVYSEYRARRGRERVASAVAPLLFLRETAALPESADAAFCARAARARNSGMACALGAIRQMRGLFRCAVRACLEPPILVFGNGLCNFCGSMVIIFDDPNS